MLELDDKPVGKGQERTCYVHPDDPNKAVKVLHGDKRKQTLREIACYRELEARRSPVSFSHLPRFYGWTSTNKGEAIVVDLVRDYDGSISKSLKQLLYDGHSIEEFTPQLRDLKRYFLDNRVVFNNDMSRQNLLFQKVAPGLARLVIVDGIGDHVRIKTLNAIPFLVRHKIRRRWERFERKMSLAAAQIADERRSAGVPDTCFEPAFTTPD